MLNIFNPNKIFRDELTNSWCYGIVTNHSKDLIPLEKDPPCFVMQSTDDTDYFVGVLPLNRSWDIIDCSKFNNLYMTININTDKCGFHVLLSSIDGDDEVESVYISLDNYGLMIDCEQNFSIPLVDFCETSGFDITKVRLIKFVGSGDCIARISGVYLE